MKKLAKNLFNIVASIILVLSFVFTGCTQTPSQPEPPQPPTTITPGTATEQVLSTPPSGFMRMRLSVSEPPLLGKPVRFTVSLTIGERVPIEKYDDTSIEIILPEGFELVSGVLKGSVNVLKNSPAQFEVTVKSVKTGIWDIEAVALYTEIGNVGNLGVARHQLYFDVSENSTVVSDMPLSPPGIPSPTFEESPYPGPTPIPPGPTPIPPVPER